MEAPPALTTVLAHRAQAWHERGASGAAVGESPESRQALSLSERAEEGERSIGPGAVFGMRLNMSVRDISVKTRLQCLRICRNPKVYRANGGLYVKGAD